MKWTTEMTTRLIELFQEKRVLWDPMDVNFKNRSKKRNAWTELGTAMEIDADQVEKKIRMLVGQFQRELRRGKNGNGLNAPYKTKWSFFKTLLFLKIKNEQQHSIEVDLSQKPTKQEVVELEDYDNNSLMENNEQSDSQIRENTILSEVKSNNMIKKADTMTEEAYGIMHQLSDNMRTRDEFDVFGELVAHTLRNLKSKSAQSNTKYEIYNILHRAELDDE